MELFGIICSVLGAGTMAHLFMRLLTDSEIESMWRPWVRHKTE